MKILATTNMIIVNYNIITTTKHSVSQHTVII